MYFLLNQNHPTTKLNTFLLIKTVFRQLYILFSRLGEVMKMVYMVWPTMKTKYICWKLILVFVLFIIDVGSFSQLVSGKVVCWLHTFTRIYLFCSKTVHIPMFHCRQCLVHSLVLNLGKYKFDIVLKSLWSGQEVVWS